MLQKVKILSVPLFVGRISSLITVMIEEIKRNSKNNYCISATGAHGIITAQKNDQFKNILNSFYLNLPDGMPGVFVGRLKGSKQMQRCYGPELFLEIMSSTENLPVRHYLCGGKQGVADQLKRICGERFSGCDIVGTYSPPFREFTDEELRTLAEEINSKDTHILWIGLSTPKQEIFAHRLSKFTNVHFICTVGAAFDFHTGKVRQAPKIVQKLALEWLFRLIMEPKRLWKRYFEIVPLFIYYNLKELGIFIFNKMFGRKKIYAE